MGHFIRVIMEIYTIYIKYPHGEMFAKSFKTFDGLLTCFKQHLDQVNSNWDLEDAEVYDYAKPLDAGAKESYISNLKDQAKKFELEYFEEFIDDSMVYITRGPLGD